MVSRADKVKPKGNHFFYAAKLKWMQWLVSYIEHIIYSPAGGVKRKSRFRNVLMPEFKNDRK
jgi:hypothetical protein